MARYFSYTGIVLQETFYSLGKSVVLSLKNRAILASRGINFSVCFPAIKCSETEYIFYCPPWIKGKAFTLNESEERMVQHTSIKLTSSRW